MAADDVTQDASGLSFPGLPLGGGSTPEYWKSWPPSLSGTTRMLSRDAKDGSWKTEGNVSLRTESSGLSKVQHCTGCRMY